MENENRYLIFNKPQWQAERKARVWGFDWSDLSKSTRWGTRKICNSCGQDWKKEWSQPLKEGQEIDEGVFVRKFKDGGWEVHGFNEDSAKEVISALKMLIPSQPLKEEEGECCGEWTGKDSYDCDKDGARTKQGTCKCKCHQEKETENYMIGDEDELLDPEYEKETPKKLPSERIEEIRSKMKSYEGIPYEYMDSEDQKVYFFNSIEAIKRYLDETAKDLPTTLKNDF